MIPLRDYQNGGVNDLRDCYRNGYVAPVYVLACGGGKTPVFASIAHGAEAKGKRVLILAHRRELIKQASRKLTDTGAAHGIIAPGFTPTRDLVQVASVQTVVGRLEALPDFDLIILDEAHNAIAGQWDRIIKAQPKAKMLGVTATPERQDGRGLGRHAGGPFDCMVLGPSVAELTAQGYLCPARVYAPAEPPDLSGIRTKAGDYDHGDLERRINVATITGNVLDHWKRLARDLPTIAFCISIQHAEDVAASFRAAGVRAVCGHGKLPTSQRDAVIGGLATGEVQVLTTCDLVSEGLDVPVVGACIMLRPTKSLRLYIQQVGRGLRPAPGKECLIVLDHAGCTMIHGLPDEPREWSLDGRKKAAAAPKVCQCPSCFALQRPARECVACGFLMVQKADKPGEGRKLEHVDGELVEVDRARVEAIRKAKLADILTGHETKAQLQEIAKAKGYHPYWVIRQLQERRARRAA